MEIPLSIQTHLSLEPIKEKQQALYFSLSHLYEAEFAPLTGVQSDSKDDFPISTPCPAPRTWGWILYAKETPCGFVVIQQIQEVWDVAEFFIHPDYRAQQYGFILARHLFLSLKGKWQVRQLISATYATKFWRKVLQNMKIDFIELQEVDPHWGSIIKQTFST